MKKKFSTKWNSSKNVAKQRKFRFNAPLHIKHRFLSVHLAKDLKKKYGRRSVAVRVGDKVKILRGQYKGRVNKVENVDLGKTEVFITGIERSKKDGSKSHIPLTPSNLMITELNLDDKMRKAKLEGVKVPKKEAPAPKTEGVAKKAPSETKE